MFKHPKAPVVAAARYVVDSLEPRRLLTSYTIEGTANDDTITINAITNNGIPFYEVTINGELEVLGPGNPLGNSLRVLALEGNDVVVVRDTNFDDSMSVWGGPGDDHVTVGSGNFGSDIDGIVEMFELENEGVDTLVIHDAADEIPPVPHYAIHITDSSVYADEPLTIDGLAGFGPHVEFKVVNMSTFADRVFADAPVVGMTVNLGGGANSVFYGGENNVLFGTVFPMTINAGVNDDWVYFKDDSGGTTGRDYTITPTAVMNQTLSGIEHVVLQTRHATNAAPNEIELTGKPPGVQSIDIDGGPGGVVQGSATTLSIGQQAAPIDLDSVDVTLRLVNVQAVISIWDQDDDSTTDPFFFWTDPPQSQQLSKGAFRLSLAPNVTAILFVTGGSTNDDFNVSVVAPNSTIQLAGGGGDDVLHSSAPARLDSIYIGALFHFDGGDGNDSALFDDSSDNVGDGDQAYFLGPDWLAKGSTIGFNPDPLVSYSAVEQLRLSADADHNDITFGSGPTRQVTIIGGSGNDFITNYATGTAALSSYGFDTYVSGGLGNDTLAIVDRVDQLVTEYIVDTTAFSFRVGTADVRTMSYDVTLENLSIDEHDGAAISRLRSKPAALRLTVNGWGGADSFFVGGGDFDNGWVTGTVTLAGGTGNDSIEFDDRMDISGIPTTAYTLDNLSLTRGSITFTYGSFESQTLRAADGFTPSFVVDVININAISLFLNSTTIIGPSTRQSSVNVTTGNLVNISGTLTVQMSAANLDTVNVNDQGATADKTYVIAAGQMTVQPGPTINYSGVDRVNLQAGSGADFIAVDTIAAGSSVNAHGNGGNDTLRLGVADVPANLLGRATVSGDAGTDLLIAASAFSTQFASAELTSSTYTNGLPHAYNTVEQLRIIQTQGGSTLNIRSVGAPTTVLGGAGDDAITIGNGDFDANILANVSVSGAGGDDSILVNDSTDDLGNDSYFLTLVSSGTVNDFSKPQTAARHLSFTTVDQFSVLGSPQNDEVTFNWWTSTPITFDAGGGNDTMFVSNGILDAIPGALNLVGGSGTDSIRVLDDLADTPATFRVAGNTVTRTPGPFGSFGGLTHESAEFLTIFAGSTADTFNVRPLASTELTIRGLGPTTGTGDTLNLAFASVTSTVFTPNGTGSGRYTFGNAAPLNYNEIETKAIDAVAPTSLGASFEYNLPRQEIRFQFSEDVSAALNTGFLTLNNTTTSQAIPTSDLAVTFDFGTNTARFTYVGNPAGILPDGDYHAEFAAGILDNFGNASTDPVLLEFFFLQGDANHDRRVNLADFNILAANFGQSNRTFSQGDFDYSGNVNLSDFNLLASRFGGAVGPDAGDAARGEAADEELPDELDELLA